MPLTMEVALDPGDPVLDGDSAPGSPLKGGTAPPLFGPYLLWPNSWMDQDATWYKCRLGSGHIVLAPPKKGAQPPIFGPCLLCPNAWMDQDATYHGGRPRPRRPCVRWGPSSLLKGGTAPPLFGPCLLWPNSWMDHHQAATRYGGRPHCVRWGPSSPKGGGAQRPQFSAHVYCCQTAGWIKMPLDTEVRLGQDDIVLDVDPAPPKGAQQPM